MPASQDTPSTQGQLLEEIRQVAPHFPGGHPGWELAPELPSGEEILASAYEVGELPHNPVDETWPSKEAYLETQYTLLRREGTEGLRHAVNSFRSKPDIRDNEAICVYKKVRVVGYLMAKLGPICRVGFSTENALHRIKWQQSRRLTPGALVAISTAADKFRKLCMVATIAQRPYKDGLDQKPPLVDIIWANPNEAIVDPELELIMVESRSGYFEAVRHTLVGLQMARSCNSPIDKYLINGDSCDAPARFLQVDPIMDVSSLVHTTDTFIDWKLMRNHNVLNGMPDLGGITSLDSSQIDALHRIITKELAIVQGPPGTGKTFTSIAALRVCLGSRKIGDPPLIVAAQTNHALDQLLSLLFDHKARILRVGGRTENERIAEHTVFKMRQRSKCPQAAGLRALDAARQVHIQTLKELGAAAFSGGLLDPAGLLQAGVLTQAQYESLVDDDMEQCEVHQAAGPFSVWLGDACIPARVLRQSKADWIQGDDEDFEHGEYEYDGDLEHIAADEEDRDRIRGPFIHLAHKWSGKEPAHLSSWERHAERELKKDDLFEIPRFMRGAVYQLLLAKYVTKLQPMFAENLQKYTDVCKETKVKRWEKDALIVKEDCIDIVGCTTTGLTKYRSFLAALHPRTMLIEEAAETREANISSALYPSIQQLILVGDHLQLAPQCDVRWLGQAPFNLDVSMFQRMVNLHMPYIMLNQQRRMIPAIREIVATFYPDLSDHPLVTDTNVRAPVPGMGGNNTWLFTHSWAEETDSNHSKLNEQEAQMIVSFFSYLVSNGVKPTKITILTFYNGQRKVILSKLRKHGSVTADSFNVFTIDSYQGEENDIVLLSLVRSPREGKPCSAGFLENQNRAVVAISRARRGFYLFGDMDNLFGAHQTSYELWGKIWNGFAENGWVKRQLGLPLTCQKHNNVTWIKDVDDWGDNAGGCTERCQDIRPCGHRCTLKCHITQHENLGCSEPCRKIMECGHGCANMCGQECQCHCENYLLLKERRETLSRQAENRLHLPFEEVLRLELDPTAPPVPGPELAEPSSITVAQGSRIPRPYVTGLLPPTTALADGRREMTAAGARFQAFAGNVEEHDRQDYLDRCAGTGVVPEVACETGELIPIEPSSSGLANPIGTESQQAIHETYKATQLVDGRRAPAGRQDVVHGGRDGPGPSGDDGEDWLIDL